MPFRYTAGMSIEDAAAQAAGLGVRYRSISIEPMYEAFVSALSEEFAGCAVDVTEQNIQARCRGVLLMAISNKKGCLVLTTGNKSEMAVGYSTLYGDMAGGFDVLKDVPKTLVFALARYRNSITALRRAGLQRQCNHRGRFRCRHGASRGAARRFERIQATPGADRGAGHAQGIRARPALPGDIGLGGRGLRLIGRAGCRGCRSSAVLPGRESRRSGYSPTSGRNRPGRTGR